MESRDFKLYFGSTWGTCIASLGLTKVVASVSCDIQSPKASRPNEGMIFINVELNPLAASHFEPGRQTELGVLINRQLEKCFKDSRCIDLESLCIVADQKVWNIRVDVNVINHDGNLIDCASIATLAALSHFHRPDVTSTGDSIIIHSFAEKDPLPLTLFHSPICVSLTTFENGITVMDPTYIEERLGVTQLTLGLNAYREMCCLHFDHTTRSRVSTDILSNVMNKAANCAVNLVKKIKDIVKTDVQTRYNKEEAKACRFKDTIPTDKITSMMTERIQIRLARWNTATNYKIENESQTKDNNDKNDEDINDVEMDQDDTKVVKLDIQSAELINNNANKIGEGGKNTWNLSEPSDEDMEENNESENDNDDIEVIDVNEKDNKSIENIELSDSEEEDTGTLTKDDLI